MINMGTPIKTPPFIPSKAHALPPQQTVTQIMEQRPLSKEKTGNRKLGTPGANGRMSLPGKELIQQTHNVPMQLGDTLRMNNSIEKEDDIGQIQQVSGGFGDSTNLDEASLKLMIAQQQRAEALAAKYQVVDMDTWQKICESPEYEMES